MERTVTVDVGPRRAERILARARSEGGEPYLRASVEVVHEHGCACTRFGRKFGPCDCGGDALYEAWKTEERQ